MGRRRGDSLGKRGDVLNDAINVGVDLDDFGEIIAGRDPREPPRPVWPAAEEDAEGDETE